jgi:hypothetical protein
VDGLSQLITFYIFLDLPPQRLCINPGSDEQGQGPLNQDGGATGQNQQDGVHEGSTGLKIEDDKF